MYAYFSLNERELLKVLAMYRHEIKEKGVDPKSEPARKVQIPVFLGLANEEGYPHKGTYDFAESTVDSGTATLRLHHLPSTEPATSTAQAPEGPRLGWNGSVELAHYIINLQLLATSWPG